MTFLVAPDQKVALLVIPGWANAVPVLLMLQSPQEPKQSLLMFNHVQIYHNNTLWSLPVCTQLSKCALLSTLCTITHCHGITASSLLSLFTSNPICLPSAPTLVCTHATHCIYCWTSVRLTPDLARPSSHTKGYSNSPFNAHYCPMQQGSDFPHIRILQKLQDIPKWHY